MSLIGSLTGMRAGGHRIAHQPHTGWADRRFPFRVTQMTIRALDLNSRSNGVNLRLPRTALRAPLLQALKQRSTT
jgi:hypothetical protein